MGRWILGRSLQEVNNQIQNFQKSSIFSLFQFMGLGAGRDTKHLSKFCLGRYTSKALAFGVVIDVMYEWFGAKLCTLLH
jgi:hypothetical protein